MALPLSNTGEEEDELVDGFESTGYAQLPADHLSDSSESSNGTSCNLAYDTLPVSFTSLQMENLATFHNVDVHNSTLHQNGASIAHINGMEIQAETHNEGVGAYQIGRHVAHIDVMENGAATEAVAHGRSFQNGDHVTHADGMENQGAASNRHALCGNVVHIDGMEIHVYGQLAGLQLSSYTLNNLVNHDDDENIDDEDYVDESERQRTEDAAFQRAKEADDARRLAPLPPDRCQAIKSAMQNISLGDFRPEWADRLPEEQWVNRLRRKSVSKSVEG